ncbi:hypothetical protein [Thalassovita sp.]|uniref:hypothetical protein n=1 Tax=Thalassovita sp. TaxID=1979401 RepID=UPI0029DE863B|nr:hypothetical protein [Thalassovita sp.]
MTNADQAPLGGLAGQGAERPFLGAPALVVAKDASDLTMISWLRSAGLKVSLSGDFNRAIQLVLTPGDRFRLLIVEIDDFGGITMVIDALRFLRDSRPDLPVLLVSHKVAAHDFSVGRLPICDVTLKAPASPTAMKEALSEAVSNNLAWQQRSAQLHPTGLQS